MVAGPFTGLCPLTIPRWKMTEKHLHNSEQESLPVEGALLGLIVGDALGVPVEFNSRYTLQQTPITTMTGYGTHDQPPGTWSDDSSLTLCLADELSGGYSLYRIAQSFVKWMYEGHWTPYGEVFDIGNTTREAIRRLREGMDPERAGDTSEAANGNGALMRILPLLFELQNVDGLVERYTIISKVAGMTHGHIRTALACFYYLEFAQMVLGGYSLEEAYKAANGRLLHLAENLGLVPEEFSPFDRLILGNIHQRMAPEIESGGYVIHTLEASIWCILTTTNYQDAVLTAVNLGEDTDTTGAVTGGLAGLVYGEKDIPREWLDQIARLDDIRKVCDRLGERYKNTVSGDK